MDYLIDIFFSVPFLFWNLLWLGDFHFGLLIFLYFRLKRTRSQGLVLSEIGFELPSVTVVLPLLRLGSQDIACVRALLSQDHPNYRLRIALDASAPRGALDLAQLEAVLAEYPAIAVDLLPCAFPPSLGASGGSQAFYQAIQACQRSKSPPTVLALVTPQLMPRTTWLRELTAPLSLQGMTATTSCPWQGRVPRSRQPRLWLRSQFQYAWNALAAIQMIAVGGLLWQGSMAVKTGYLLQPYVLERWKRMGQTDVALGQLLYQEGHQIRLVGALMSVRRSTSPPTQFGQEIRQRLAALRLHHRFWLLLAAQGLFVSLTNLRFLAKMFWSVLGGDFRTMGWITAGFCFYLLALVLLIETTERFVVATEPTRKMTGNLNELSGNRVMSYDLLLILIVPLMHLTQALTTVQTIVSSQDRRQRAPSIPHPKSTSPKAVTPKIINPKSSNPKSSNPKSPSPKSLSPKIINPKIINQEI